MIKNDKLVQQLINNLPSFYNEYSYDMNFIYELFDTYISASGILERYAQYICNNTSLETAEIYKPLAKKPLVLQNSLYNVLEIAEQFSNDTGEAWFDVNTTLARKIAFLDSIGKYETITDVYSTTGNNELVVDFKICKDFSGLLGHYTPLEDYVYRDYKLYLFNDLAKPLHNKVSKTVLLEDVKSNDHKLELQWGIFYPVIYSMFMTRPEYRDMLAAMVRFDSSIGVINEVMQAANIPRTVVVQDRYTRKNLSPTSLRSFNQNMGPFDFIFKLPPEYVGVLSPRASEFRLIHSANLKNYSPEDLSYLYTSFSKVRGEAWLGRIINVFNFINLIKPTHVSFSLEGTVKIFDRLTTTDFFSSKSTVSIIDILWKETMYGLFRYSLKTYNRDTRPDAVNLLLQHTINELYGEYKDIRLTTKSTHTINELYTISSEFIPTIKLAMLDMLWKDTMYGLFSYNSKPYRQEDIINEIFTSTSALLLTDIQDYLSDNVKFKTTETFNSGYNISDEHRLNLKTSIIDMLWKDTMYGLFDYNSKPYRQEDATEETVNLVSKPLIIDTQDYTDDSTELEVTEVIDDVYAISDVQNFNINAGYISTTRNDTMYGLSTYGANPYKQINEVDTVTLSIFNI